MMDGPLSWQGQVAAALFAPVLWWGIPGALGVFDGAPFWRALLLGWFEVFV